MKTNTLKHSITITKGNEKTVIRISLADDCRNGHEDFSMTATVYENGRDVMGGCCHEHILALRPDLAPFAALHLADASGVPMYAVENGFYWFQGMYPHAFPGSGGNDKSPQECTRILTEHLRATDEQISAIIAAYPHSKAEFQFILETLGFPAIWKAEANAAIARLKEWTGNTFKSEATRVCWASLSDEIKADIEHKRATGYYDPANVAKRDQEKAEKLKAAKLAEIDADLAKDICKLESKAKVARFILNHVFKKNVIFYGHMNTLAVNWTTTEALYTEDDFQHLKTFAGMFAAELPEGIKLEWQARPKY